MREDKIPIRNEVRAERQIHKREVGLYIIQHDREKGRSLFVTELKSEPAAELETFHREPTVSLTYEAAQVLVDELASAGFRPTSETRTNSAIKATERHLEDMRQIVSVKLSVPFVSDE